MGEDLAIPSVVNASAVTSLQIPLLDRRFALRTAPWPEIHAALVHRPIIRSRRLGLRRRSTASATPAKRGKSTPRREVSTDRSPCVQLVENLSRPWRIFHQPPRPLPYMRAVPEPKQVIDDHVPG
jgi:hypothetical protein